MESVSIILIGFVILCIIVVILFEKNKKSSNNDKVQDEQITDIIPNYEKINNIPNYEKINNIPNYEKLNNILQYERPKKPEASDFEYAYDKNQGPYLGKPMNVPVPARSLKLSNEQYKYPFYRAQIPLQPYDFFKPYGPNNSSMQNTIVPSDTPFYYYPNEYTPTLNTVPFISSVDSFAPFPEVNTPWEKTGILTNISVDDFRGRRKEILNLYRRPIAPLQDLFEYTVQDKDGFIIKLENVKFLEDGDIIPFITGKNGKWKVHSYIDNKWVWA